MNLSGAIELFTDVALVSGNLWRHGVLLPGLYRGPAVGSLDCVPHTVTNLTRQIADNIPVT